MEEILKRIEKDIHDIKTSLNHPSDGLQHRVTKVETTIKTLTKAMWGLYGGIITLIAKFFFGIP